MYNVKSNSLLFVIFMYTCGSNAWPWPVKGTLNGALYNFTCLRCYSRLCDIFRDWRKPVTQTINLLSSYLLSELKWAVQLLYLAIKHMIFTWQINKQVKKIGWTIGQPYLEQEIQPRESLYQQLLKTPNLHPKKRYKILSAVYGHMQETFQSVKSVTEAERRW